MRESSAPARLVGAAVLAIALVGAAAAALGAAGDLDPGFGTAGKVTAGIGTGGGDDNARAVVIQADGKIVAAGKSFIGDDNAGPFAVVRYNTDGSLDTSFGGGDGVVTTAFGADDAQVNALAIQADGKIVAAGGTFVGGIGGQTGGSFAVARYTASGLPDTSFSGDGQLTTTIGDASEGKDVAIQPNGAIVVGGGTFSEGQGGDFAIVRYESGGALDLTFGAGGRVTTDFGGNEDASGVGIQSNGEIVAGGFADTDGGDFAAARYEPDGDLDATTTPFGSGGKVVTDFSGAGSEDGANDVAIQSTGEIVLAGISDGQFALARYASSGSPDGSFGGGDGLVTTDIAGTFASGNAVDIHGSSGEIVVAGSAQTPGGGDFDTDLALARYEPDGDLDATTTPFSGDGKLVTNLGAGDEAGGVAIDSASGEVVVAALSRSRLTFRESSDFVVARYESDGDLDATTTPFDGDGIANTVIGTGSRDEGFAVAVQGDGKIVVAGYTVSEAGIDHGDFALARFNSNGTPDTTFGGGDGEVITDFSGAGLWDIANGVAIEPDGEIVVAGTTQTATSDLAQFAVARYEPDGDLDATTTPFSADGKQTTGFGAGSDDIANDVAVQASGAIVAVGVANPDNPGDIAIAQFDSNGAPDTSFGGGDGKVTTDVNGGAGVAVAIQSNSEIVVAGEGSDGVATGFTVARYEPDGDLDATTTPFSGDGIVAASPSGTPFNDAKDVAIQPNGSIVAAGDIHVDAPVPRCGGGASQIDLGAVRFEADGDLDLTFSGDGKLTVDFGDVDSSGAVALQSDGAVLVAGQATGDFGLARFTSAGAVDTSFGGGDGEVTTDFASGSCDEGHDVAVTPAGILVAGTSESMFALARYQATTPVTSPPPTGTTTSDKDPPETKLTKKPKKRSTKRKAKFEFEADEPKSTFECKLDRKPFKSCSSPFRKRVKIGRHTFRVRATDAAGNTDPSPAKARFKVVEPD